MVLGDLNESVSDVLCLIYEKMFKMGNLCFCVKLNWMLLFDVFGEVLLNFGELFDDVCK